MSFYCFETRQDRTLAPYPPPEFSQQIEKMSPSEIVDHIINTNIDQLTLSKIEKAIAVPLRQLISPRENRRRRVIPRPQNNFVLYRRNFHAVITKEQGHSVAKNFKLISNEAAKNWSEESNEIKQLYELIADCAKKVHDCTYPQYVYQPKHKSNKKGANGTIFREVTVDSCSKKNDKNRDKDMKELLKEKEDLKRDKITMTKSFVASTTFLADITPPNIASIASKADLSSSSEDNSKKWRWAHYTQSDPPNNVSNNSNTNNITSNITSVQTTPSLLPPIDIPISSNFLATYDRNIWSLVNGYTNV